MLFRILAVLLLCSSLGMCATLSLYQTETKEDEEAAAVATPAADGHVGDSSDTNSFFGDNLLAKVLGVDNQGGSQPIVEADGATVREPGNDSDKPATESLIKEAVNQRPPSEEEANDIRPAQANTSQNKPQAQEDENSWSFNSIRNSFQNVHGYFDSLVELVGGRDGICQYRCRYGELPLPRPGYQQAEPNGCSSSLVGFQLDMGIPAMTTCCNQLDTCYDTCGLNKYDCDAKFRSCLLSICSDLKKSLGFVSKVQACESVADTLYNTVWTFGCRPYMNSQRAACVCQEEDKDEL